MALGAHRRPPARHANGMRGAGPALNRTRTPGPLRPARQECRPRLKYRLHNIKRSRTVSSGRSWKIGAGRNFRRCIRRLFFRQARIFRGIPGLAIHRGHWGTPSPEDGAVGSHAPNRPSPAVAIGPREVIVPAWRLAPKPCSATKSPKPRRWPPKAPLSRQNRAFLRCGDRGLTAKLENDRP